MKRVIVAIDMVKLAVQVPSSLVDLAKPSVKEMLRLVEGQIPESYRNRELLAK